MSTEFKVAPVRNANEESVFSLPVQRILRPRFPVRGGWMLLLVVSCLLAGCQGEVPIAPPAAGPATGQTIRCAVIGGLADTGLWQALGDQFRKATGHAVEIVARGPKHQVLAEFVNKKAHMVAMHACDAIINAVADGNAVDPQPWARNDFVIVGPIDDPAGVRGYQDAGAALRAIIESGNKLLVHASHGSMEVLHELLEAERLELNPEHTLVRLDDRHRQMLLYAGQQQAYTIVGRIPFVNGKVPKQNLEMMVAGDPRLRRPYVVAVASDTQLNPQETAAARQFAQFLRSPSAQATIAEYGRGLYDERPLFFSVEVPEQGRP